MNTLFSLMLASFTLALSVSSCGTRTQTSPEDEFKDAKAMSGYVIDKDIPVARSKDANAVPDYTVKAGRVCLKSDEKPDCYYFELTDASETVTLDQNHVAYYEPAQDDVPARYAKREVFDRSVQEVSIYTSAPRSWKAGTAYTLVPRNKESLVRWVTVRPVVIKDKDAVFVESTWNSADGTCKQTRTPMCGKIVCEVTLCTHSGTYTIYAYNGEELMPNAVEASGSYSDVSYEDMTIDEQGRILAKEYGDAAPFQPIHEVSGPVDIPCIGFAGWISPTQMVINDDVYDVDDGSCQKAPTDLVPSCLGGK
ncbi:MAG: hypothetical protein HUK00_04090 [Bacteroidaceae bacterium]|nr:hypothetical protein [Bacteroidaceae bacterium]